MKNLVILICIKSVIISHKFLMEKLRIRKDM